MVSQGNDDPGGAKGKGKDRGRPQERAGPADILCYFYQQDRCNMGNKCRFSHDRNNYKIKGTNPGNRNKSPSRGRSPSVKLKCHHYDGRTSSCPYGKDCKFFHDKDNPEPKNKRGSRSPSQNRDSKRGTDRNRSPSRNKDGKRSHKDKRDKTGRGKRSGSVATTSESDDEGGNKSQSDNDSSRNKSRSRRSSETSESDVDEQDKVLEMTVKSESSTDEES